MKQGCFLLCFLSSVYMEKLTDVIQGAVAIKLIHNAFHGLQRNSAVPQVVSDFYNHRKDRKHLCVTPEILGPYSALTAL